MRKILGALSCTRLLVFKAAEETLDKLGKNKDGITALIAIILLVVGGYQYFVVAVESRIKYSLNLLERREGDTFVNARTVMIQKWIDNENLRSAFAATNTYTPELIGKATEEIFEDSEYRKALYNISTYYTNAAACALDGICDAPTMCASLAGEIQDYLDVNRGYFVYATKIRQEDAVSLTLSMPEFVIFCSSALFVNEASRHDRSWWCRTNLYSQRMIGLHFRKSCAFFATPYQIRIEAEAEKLELQDSN